MSGRWLPCYLLLHRGQVLPPGWWALHLQGVHGCGVLSAGSEGAALAWGLSMRRVSTPVPEIQSMCFLPAPSMVVVALRGHALPSVLWGEGPGDVGNPSRLGQYVRDRKENTPKLDCV